MAKQEVPKLSKDERVAALNQALKARRARAEVKQKVRDGELSLDDVLGMKNDPVIARMKVRDLVASFKSIGEVKSQKIMQQCEISESRRLMGLGHLQEARLREVLSCYSV